MTSRTSDGVKAPYLLIALIATQIFCAAFFVWDVVTDLRASETGGGPPWPIAIEAVAAVVLCLACVIEVRFFRDQLRRNAQLQRSLTFAQSAVHDVIEALFDDWKLTPSERDVAMMLVKGLSNSEIAELRGNAESTVKSHLNSVYRKADTTGRGEFLSLILDRMME